MIDRKDISFTTLVDGTYTQTFKIRHPMFLDQVFWDGANLAASHTLTLTQLDEAGETTTLLSYTGLASASFSYKPRIPSHDISGVASTSHVAHQVIAGVVTLTVSGGGDTNSGKITLYMFN